jgi:hypothetical protein
MTLLNKSQQTVIRTDPLEIDLQLIELEAAKSNANALSASFSQHTDDLAPAVPRRQQPSRATVSYDASASRIECRISDSQTVGRISQFVGVRRTTYMGDKKSYERFTDRSHHFGADCLLPARLQKT